ncbi:hypothetical protein Tco_1282914 [Tanacetum coccineum]
MADQEQIPPQQEQPFVAAKQVGFNLEDIILNTNNEKPIYQISNMYKEYLAEFWYSAKALENSKVSFSIPTAGIHDVVGVNTFRNAIGAHYLPHPREYVAPPFIDILTLPWFEIIGYGIAVPAKGTLKKSLLPLRWSAAEPVAFKAPKPSSKVERVPKAQSLELNLDTRRNLLL